MKLTRFGRTASQAALALSILTGGAVIAATPAAAKEKKAEAPKASYSKGFIAVYQPLNALLTAATPDVAGALAQVPTLLAAIETDDDRNAAGNVLLMIGQKNGDKALQAQGLDLMLASGKTSADKLGVVQFSAGQLAYIAENYGKARDHILRALEAGYVNDEAEGLVAETYFSEKKYAEGLTYLQTAIEARKAAGKPVKEDWIRRGLAVAYTNNVIADASKYALMYVDGYPSATSWNDALAIHINTQKYQAPEALDLLRLGARLQSFKDSRLFVEYLDAADYRRLPTEVLRAIDYGVAKGLIKLSDAYVADTRKQASVRAAADARDVVNLTRDARAGGASYATIMAAGDMLLSMEKPAEAEEFYTKALGVAGVNTPLVLTRLGIAQTDQGKYAEAQTTFAKVEGARQAIASLWSIYTKQKAASATPAAQ